MPRASTRSSSRRSSSRSALGDGVSIVGRIDLVRRIDTGETTIVDLKSSERAQAEDVTEAQLHVYALGYENLTGQRPGLRRDLRAGRAQAQNRARWTMTLLRTSRLRCVTQLRHCVRVP